MALYTELSVYRDTYQLILKVFEYTKDFPKEYKYTLGQDMKRDALHLLRCIYRANKHKNRAEQLDVFLDEFELLKLEIRLSTDMKLFSTKKQAVLSALMATRTIVLGSVVLGVLNKTDKQSRREHQACSRFLSEIKMSIYDQYNRNYTYRISTRNPRIAIPSLL